MAIFTFLMFSAGAGCMTLSLLLGSNLPEAYTWEVLRTLVGCLMGFAFYTFVINPLLERHL